MCEAENIEYIFSPILMLFAIVLCLALQFTTFYFFLNETKKCQSLYASILLVLNINILMQMTIPLIMGVFFSFSIEKEFNISLLSLFEVVMLQILYIAIFLTTFLFKNKSFKLGLPVICASIENTVSLNSFNYRCFVFIIIGFFLFGTSLSIAGIVQSVAEIAGEVQKDYSFFDVVMIYLRTMFEWTALVTAILFLFSSKGSKLIRIIVVVFCIGVVLRQLALGLRGGVFIMAVLVLFVSYVKSNKINFSFVIPLLIVLIPIFSFLGGSFRESITSGFLVEAEMYERLEIIVSKMFSSDKTVDKYEMTFFESIYSRLEATRNSVSLIETFNKGEGVDFKPLISSVTALVPQQISGVKNYATSSTDNAYGTAMYVVREKTYGYTDMGPFLASAHEYWEGGPLYVIISAFLLGIIWRKVANWSVRRGYDTISLLILILFLDAHHGEMSVLFPLALVVRLFYFQILPAIIIIYCINFVSKLKIIKFVLKKQIV